jgi:hypothetical protein
MKEGDYIKVKNQSHLNYILKVTQARMMPGEIGKTCYAVYCGGFLELYREITGFMELYREINNRCLNEVFIDPPISEGSKHDSEKPRYDLIPCLAEKQVAEVLTFGAKKYGAENWRNVDNHESRYIAAAMRHIAAYRSGETIDSESGLNHLAHAVCSLMFIIEKGAK